MLFLYLPIIILIIYSFNASKFGTSWGGWSLKWYQAMFTDRSLWAAVMNSLIIALVSSTVSVILGTMAALGLNRYKHKAQKFFNALLYLPMIIPELVLGVGLLMFFVLLNFTLGLYSIMIAHITFSISYVTFVVLTRLSNFNRSLEEASYDLGATPWHTFWHITFPIIFPGILAGYLLAFTMSIDDFIITFFTAGVGSTTLPLKIYSMIKFSVTPEINAISTIIVVFTVILLTFVQVLQARNDEKMRQNMARNKETL
jgi:spermidine/putrescine transport system permease protein